MSPPPDAATAPVATEPAPLDGPLAPVAALLRDDPAVGAALARPGGVLAVPEPARAMVLAALAQLSGRSPIVLACPTSTDAGRLADDLSAFLPATDVELFPAWETLPFERVSPSTETMGRRLRVLWRLRHPDQAPRVVVAGVRALLQRLGPHVEDVEPVVVRPGDRLDPEELLRHLVAGGYRREELVEHRGEVAVRGSIVDVFPATADAPVRIDLWGDEVDRLTEFSVSDQRSTVDLPEASVFPAREVLPTDEVRERAAALVGQEPWGREQWERLAEGQLFDGMESWLPWLTPEERLLTDLLPPTSLVVLVEPSRLRDRAGDLLAEEDDLATTLAVTWAADTAHRFPRLHLDADRLLAGTEGAALHLPATADSPSTPAVTATSWPPVTGSGEALVRRLQAQLADGYRLVVAADGRGSAERLAGILLDGGIELPLDLGAGRPAGRPGGRVVVAPLHQGAVFPLARVAVLAEPDLTGRTRAHRRPRPRRRAAAGVFEDLKPGGYVVHHTHGVGRYAGMVKRTIGGVERDYLLLEYKGGDRLYIPSDQIDAVRQYVGGEAPALHRLGGSDFAKAKNRVRSAVREIAQELVVLYQTRVNASGHAFPADTPWQREMEDTFAYVETPDQQRAIDDVKADMEREHPMDRLVVGDVGFGKTEVAIRAAFKAVQDGKQVAVLVPTTLLASQHFQTFSDRFAGFPVRVEMLSRFLTAGQAKKVVEGLGTGEVDVVVGTHRLLSESVVFRDLGLLVVDEEQRFGVQHKEAMKKLRTNVDVLTMSATPIPRTLEMSLTGIRDLSLITTPPADRQPILTYVGDYDDRAVAEAIRRELLREGQVFFVHNRVEDIEDKAMQIRELVPEARVAVAHGQMDEGTLEQIVYDFWEGKHDVLVCTTIIESGIDMPTVNTLVVDRADRLGLGQLHQLRGRVGRSGQRAYAYLFHPKDLRLTEEAYERLKTIGEATELGSGFKIAMRDLEIRGAGNLLGENQSGHIAAVGYDLYCQMVTEAVAEMKGEEVREPAEVKLDVPVDANLPSTYVGKEELRLEAYRRLAAVTTQSEVDDIRAEWEDRYGPVPGEAEALLAVARLRAECHRLGIRDVAITGTSARVAPLALKASEEMRLRRIAKGAVHKPDLQQLVLPLARNAGDPATQLVAFLQALVPPPAGAEAPPAPSPSLVRSRRG
jgi:transcription-repair coupling factor (superfamily II helicase)